MPPAHPRPLRKLLDRAPWLLAPVLAVAALALGFAGVPPLVAVALATATSAGVSAYALVRLALRIHARQHTFGPCRGAGFLGMGVLASGVSTVAVALAPAARRPALALVGLVTVAVLYLLGLFLLPGTAATVIARLRRALDGLGVGVTLLFVAWLLVLRPSGGLYPVALGAALVACAALAIAVITGLRAARYRPAALTCAGGVSLSVAGLAALTVLLAHHAPPAAALVAGLVLVTGPVLTLTGARRADDGPSPAVPPFDADGTLAGYPLMGVPVGAALLAAAYHLLAVGPFDRTAVVLAVVWVAVLAARETLAAVDVRRYARRLATQEAHFRSLVAGAADVTVVLDDDLVVRWQSPAAARQFGLSDADVVGREFTALVHPDDAADVAAHLRAALAGAPDAAPTAGAPTGARTAEPGRGGGDDERGREPERRTVLVSARLRDGFGAWRDTESTVSDQRGVPEVGALVVHVRDVGERRQLERTLHEMAFTDQLTGLANRRELLRTVATTRGRAGAVLVIDLDGFTGVNDVRGHDVGDAVLIEVARRLRTGTGADGLAARLGGDEFAVVTGDGAVQAYALGTRLLTMLIEPYEVPGSTVRLSASVGLAEIAGDNVDDVVRRADLALRRAKQLGRNRVEWYDESLEDRLRRQMSMEQELPGVAGRGELDLAYQPVLELGPRRPVGAEALLRWRHPTLGTLVPGDFIPVAERLGTIGEIGEWVLHAACRQLSAWLRDGWDLWMSINVSAGQLAAPGFVASVAAALESHQIPAERLVVEVAEHWLGLDVPRAVTQLAGLRALGVRTAIDHFGTGQTSLAYLRRLPVDVLKIDRALFAEPAGRTGPAAPIIDVVVGLGRRLGLTVIAEGLEAEAHLDVVRGAGCRYGQGYLFGHPAPAEHVEAYLEAHRAPSLSAWPPVDGDHSVDSEQPGSL